ncbi:MAG: beta-glucosidase [Actinomycetota bacterium]|jgi:beta-glucosidase|nr:beta-glucosidase [Actinomycetota bacterium]
MTSPFPAGFLWGAATSPHQTEGGNVSSDWWALEHAGNALVRQRSGDAVDSYHRWPEDMDLLAEAGFTDYRFGVEWARIEPVRGEFSQAAIDHYTRMVDGALTRGLRPLLTLHHFTSPEWFAERGGWVAADAPELFERYVGELTPLLASALPRVCTINEPNLLAVMPRVLSGEARLEPGLPLPDESVVEALLDAHARARKVLKNVNPGIDVGWSVACQAFQPEPGAEQACAQHALPRETRFLTAARDDDWVGVQSYTRHRVGLQSEAPVVLPMPADAERTLNGWEVYPQALGQAVREAAEASGVPVIVTENGIATDDDAQRIAYTDAALASLAAAVADGVDVRGYFHWSLLDNFEWGRWEPTFGLVAVDRTTFRRTPKPSLTWLGARAPR